MSGAEEIIAARRCGVVRCGLSLRRSQTVSGLAREFGLRDDPRYYDEINALDANYLIWLVLHRDLAYNAEIMPAARAADLRNRFLAQFNPATRYFTNGTWHLPPITRPDGVIQGASWQSVTDATFDTGVLAISPKCSGCLWVEDED